MLGEDIDFYDIFKIHRTAMALLTADLQFIDVNDEFLDVVDLPLEDVIGHHAFEIAPKVPEDPDGNPKWTALEAALTSGHREVYQLQRYDVEDPPHSGAYHERYWASAVTPIRGLDGEVDVLEFSARDVTPIIGLFLQQYGELGIPVGQPVAESS